MDLQAAERAIKALETEAQRVRGLGDLRAELSSTQATLSKAVYELENVMQASSASSAAHAASIQEILAAMKETAAEAAAFQQQTLQRLQERSDDMERRSETALKGISTTLRDGLNEVHAQTRATVREVDQTVAAQVARVLVEVQTANRAATQELSDRMERLQRELATSQELSSASVVEKLRLTILMATGVLAAIVILLSWWIKA